VQTEALQVIDEVVSRCDGRKQITDFFGAIPARHMELV